MAIRSIVVDLVARTTSFTPEIDKASRALNKRAAEMNRSLQSIERGIGNLKAGFAAFAGAIALDALIAASARALDFAASLGEVAAATGVSVRDLQLYRAIGGQVNLTNEEMEASLARLTRTIGEADRGSKKQVAAFRELGVSVTDAAGNVRSAGDVIPDLADALSKIESPAKRAAIEVDLFGKSGQKLDPLLSGGSAAINEFTNRFERLGGVLSDSVSAQADAVSDRLDEMKRIVDANFARAIAENATALSSLIDQIARAASFLPAAVRKFQEFRLAVLQAQGNFQIKFGLTDNARAEGRATIARVRSERLSMTDDAFQARFGYGPGGYAGFLERQRQRQRGPLPDFESGGGRRGGGGRSAASEAARAAERAADAAKRQADEYERALRSISESLEVDRLRAQGMSFSADLQEQINGLTERYGDLGKARLDTLIQETTQATLQRDRWKEIADTLNGLADVEIKIGSDLDLGLEQLGKDAEFATGAIFGTSSAWAEFREGAAQSFDRMKQGLADAVLGFESLGDVIRSTVAELASLALQRFLFDPIFNAIGGGLGGSSGAMTGASVRGGGGLLGGLLSVAGSLFGGGAIKFGGAASGIGQTLLANDPGSLVKGFSPITSSTFNLQPFPGFASGGYTGDGGIRNIAGLVHGQEYVFDANATKRIGRANLDAMRAGNFAGLARATSNLRPANDGGPAVGSMTLVFPGVTNAKEARTTMQQEASGLARRIADARRAGIA